MILSSFFLILDVKKCFFLFDFFVTLRRQLWRIVMCLCVKY